MKYGDKQYHRLNRDGGPLTQDLRKEGWHFCAEFDEDLTDGEFMREDGSCICGFDKRLVE